MEERKDLRRLSLISKIKKEAKSLVTTIDHWCIIDVSDGALIAIDDYLKIMNDYRKEIKAEL